jgi:hypothetical protein
MAAVCGDFDITPDLSVVLLQNVEGFPPVAFV